MQQELDFAGADFETRAVSPFREMGACSTTNSLIINFKKTLDRQERPEWHCKEQALKAAAEAFRRALNREALDRLTFVPVPPSKARGDPLHDDRLTRMLHAIRPEPPLDVRELIVQTESTHAVHNREIRPRPTEIEALWRHDETPTEPAPRLVAVVDDLLTTGAHFRAAKSILSARFQGIAVVGMFIARRVRDTADLADVDDAESEP